MDQHQVALLAEQENRMWASASPSPVGREPDSSDDAGPRSGPYMPLDGTTPAAETANRLPNFEWLQATACGTVLIVRFRWLPDPHQREVGWMFQRVDLSDAEDGVGRLVVAGREVGDAGGGAV